jgi:hypothetical protein
MFAFCAYWNMQDLHGSQSSSSFILPQATRHHRLARAQNIFKKNFLRYKKLQKHIDGTGE